MILEVSHRTTYSYGRPVLRSQHLVYMTPRPAPRQRVHRHGLLIEPAPAANVAREDDFGNRSAILTIEERHLELIVHARSTVAVHAPALPAPETTTPWELVTTKAVAGDGRLDIGVLQFMSASRHTGPVRVALDYARGSFTPQRPILDAAVDLTRRIHADFTFDSTATDVSTPVLQVFEERRGVCQDFAHLAIACLRSLGLPTRYVSGYLLTLPPPGGEKLKGADASHAWISVWVPEAGWVDLDPTNGIVPTDGHITLAWGRDFADVSPISGVLLGGGRQRIDVAVDVATGAAGAQALPPEDTP